jgi:multidrug efflux system membrane fusion protein
VLDATALDRAQKVALGTGKLSSTDNQVDTTTGTVKMRAMFDNPDESLFPNQFVNIRLLVDTVKDATVVPVAAIQRGQPGTFVYLVKGDDTAHVQVVETGVTDGNSVAVTKGLNVGDQVVIDGVDRLRDGAKIRKSTPGQGNRPAAATPTPSTSQGAAGSKAPQTGEAPAKQQTGEVPAKPQDPQGQHQRGNGSRKGGTGQPAQSNQ